MQDARNKKQEEAWSLVSSRWPLVTPFSPATNDERPATRFWLRLLFLFAGGVFFSPPLALESPLAVRQPPATASQEKAQTVSAPLTQIYRVGPEDVLEIRLFNDPESFKSPDYRVSSSGYIFFSYVGNVHVSGKTTTKIEEELKRLLKNGYFENHEVDVAVKEYKSHIIYLLGEATGQLVLKREQVPLIEILAQLGVRQAATRAIITRLVNGQMTTLTVDLRSSERHTTLIQHGDIIELQAIVEQVFLTGEIRTTRPIDYVPGLTLSQAIIIAGGTSEFAKRSKIEIRRKLPDGKTEVIRADFDKIIRGKSPDIELKPGDTIYVPRRFL